MLTNTEIESLIKVPKEIVEIEPSSGYREGDSQIRCDLKLKIVGADESSDTFLVFIRQNITYKENFSIGLRYKGTLHDSFLTLVRYNGPHGETSRSADGHYNQSHIHRLTAEEMQLGSAEPQERHREITKKYSTLKESIKLFFADIGVNNYLVHIPRFIQSDMFNEH